MFLFSAPIVWNRGDIINGSDIYTGRKKSSNCLLSSYAYSFNIHINRLKTVKSFCFICRIFCSDLSSIRRGFSCSFKSRRTPSCPSKHISCFISNTYDCIIKSSKNMCLSYLYYFSCFFWFFSLCCHINYNEMNIKLFFLSRDCYRLTFSGSCISFGVLSSHRQSFLMTNSSVTSNLL